MRSAQRGPAFWRVLAGRWQARPVAVQDGALALLFLVLAAIPGVAPLGVALGELPARPFDGVAATLVVLQCLSLAVRRQWPRLSLLVVVASFVAHELRGDPPNIAGLALLIVLYSAGAHLDRNRRAAAVGASAGYVVLAVVLTRLGSPERPLDFLTFYVLLAVFVAAGVRVRAWRIAAAEQLRRDAEAARAHERTLIARELHDVVTHHVTAMVVQSDAAQFLLATPERAAAGMAAVSDTGRLALSELRQLLNLLDTSGGAAGSRAPAVGQLHDLVERTRSAGQPVELTETGERGPLGGRVELATYRVVQEALTNAVKHARGRPTAVRIHYTEQEIDIAVDTTGPPVPDPVPGRGLTGLTERVGLLGGRLEAGARPAGGFTVHASIPVVRQR